MPGAIADLIHQHKFGTGYGDAVPIKSEAGETVVLGWLLKNRSTPNSAGSGTSPSSTIGSRPSPTATNAGRAS